jgi:uncharacterized beta-barrel protein YwiB (DUF1934 family)
MPKVMLNIKGSQNGDDNIELITRGDLFKTDEGLVLEYSETEISGMEGTKNTIVINDATISLERHGEISTSIYFEEGKRFVGNYETTFGTLSMSVYPTHVSHNYHADVGKVDLEYELDLEGEQSHNRLSLEYTMIHS